MSQKYLVWSNEHQSWWRENNRGYTVHYAAAGKYTRERALAICAHARNGAQLDAPPSEIPVRDCDYRDALKIHAKAMQGIVSRETSEVIKDRPIKVSKSEFWRLKEERGMDVRSRTDAHGFNQIYGVLNDGSEVIAIGDISVSKISSNQE